MARKPWTNESVVAAIRERHAAGKPLHYTAVVADDEPLTGAARKRFGSWPAALAAAGFDPDEHRAPRVQRRRWSEALVVETIHAYLAEGVPANAHAMQRRDQSLVATAQRLFGSWDAAVTAAGLDPAETRLTRRWQPDDVTQTIQRANDAGADLSDNTVSALAGDLYTAASTHFGGWQQAIEAAGLDPDQVRRTRQHTRDTVLTELRELDAAGINVSAYLRYHAGMMKAVYRLFGNIESAYSAAGIKSDATPEPLVVRIREKREAAGLSQTALGKRVGRSHRSIGLYESGQHAVSLAMALKLAAALGCSVEDLFGLA